jgi:hypothetical protein
MNVARRRRCGAPPPTVHLQPCDKVAGHAGPHRGYLSAVDVVEFWRNEDEAPDAGAPVSVEEARAMRITHDEDEE